VPLAARDVIVKFHVETGFLRQATGSIPSNAVSVQRLNCVDDGCRAVLWAGDVDRDTVDAALTEDGTIDRTVYLGPEADGHWYAVETVDAAVRAIERALLDADGMLVRADLVGGEWIVQSRFSDRSALLTFREALLENGFDIEVQQMSESDDEVATQFGVTDPQREVLLLALECGYYTVPRDASLSDLAGRLDISSQAASERLRRGTRTLVANTLAAPERRSIGPGTH